MARRYGRCPRGERLIGRVPLGTWKTLTFVAGLRCDEMTAPLVIEGAMNGEIFLFYVEQCLAPALNHGDIVVMDNLRAHKVAGVEEAIEAVGAESRYLPKYSPDLTPISRRPSASSRRICAKLPSGRSAAFAAELASSCLASAQTNAPTTSLMPDMFQYAAESALGVEPKADRYPHSEFNPRAVERFFSKLAVQHARPRASAPAQFPSRGARKRYIHSPTRKKLPCPPTTRPHLPRRPNRRCVRL